MQRKMLETLDEENQKKEKETGKEQESGGAK